MSDPLNEEFARDFPDAFARATARGEPEAIAEILTALPPELAAAIAARLPANTVKTLMAMGLVKPEAWLGEASFDDAAALLGHLPRARGITLVNAVENRTARRKLRQFLNYPAHSVGAIVSDAVRRFSASTPVGEVLHELRTAGRATLQPAVVLDSDGLYLGTLSLARLALRDTEAGTAGDFVEYVMPLRPELPFANAAGAEHWHEHTWLPVVDHDRHVLGVVSHARVAEGNPPGSAAAPAERYGLASLATQLIDVMGELLARLLAPRRAS